MKLTLVTVLAALGVWCACAVAAEPATRPADKDVKAYVVVFNFHTQGAADAGTAATDLSKRPWGFQLADTVRLRLRRHAEYEVIDRFTTEDFAGPLAASTEADKVRKLMVESLGANLGLYGTVRRRGRQVTADVRCVDLTDPTKPTGWKKSFSDNAERARGAIAKTIVEALRGEAEWAPPQYGDEAEPKKFGKALNENGGFDSGSKGWDRPDNASTFIVDGPKGRGKILRVRTDLSRDPWLEYRRALRLGKADPTKPPEIPRDTSYSSVAGLEGVHYRGEFIKAASGKRYWLAADHNGPGGAMVFVKGFRRGEHALDGLPESALAELGLTPEQFAELPERKRRELIAADAEKNPTRYMRECWRWYLSCKGSKGRWQHFAAPFPPRGGMPKYVEFFQIQVYSYWPPGIYLWDNVHVYEDPNQRAPLPEEKPRTPNAPERGAGTGIQGGGDTEKSPAPSAQQG